MNFPEPHICEIYRRRINLFNMLTKIDNISIFNPMNEIIQFEFDMNAAIYKKSESYTSFRVFTDISYRRGLIEKLKLKINSYRQQYFTSVEWTNYRAREYIVNGLCEELRDGVPKLQTLCLLQQESSEVIAAIGNVIFGNTSFQLYPPTNSRDMIQIFRENCYHRNFLSYHNLNDLMYDYIYSIHTIAVKNKHNYIAQQTYEAIKYSSSHTFRMNIHYLAEYGFLPEYAKIDIDICKNPKYNQRLFEFYAVICNVDKIRHMINDKIDVDYNKIMKLLLYSGDLKSLFIYDLITKSLPDPTAYLNQHINELKIDDNDVVFDYLFSKSSQLPDESSFSQIENFHGSIYVLFHHIIIAHNILKLRGKNIKINEILRRLFVNEFVDIGYNVDNKICIQRLFYYLQIFDNLATKSDISLDFSSIWRYVIHLKDQEVCSWVLDKIQNKNIKLNAFINISEYIKNSSDYKWLVSLMHQHLNAFEFDNIKYLITNLILHEYDFNKDSMKEFLQSMCGLLIASGNHPNFISMFRTPQNILKSCGEQAINIMEWIEQRIIDQDEIPDYVSMMKNLSDFDLLKDWAKSKIMLPASLNNVISFGLQISVDSHPSSTIPSLLNI